MVSVTHRVSGRHQPPALGPGKSAWVGNIPDWRDSGKNDSIRMRREASHNSSFPVKSSPTITGLVAGRLYSGRGTRPSTAAAWPGVGGLSPVAGAQLDGGRERERRHESDNSELTHAWSVLTWRGESREQRSVRGE